MGGQEKGGIEMSDEPITIVHVVNPDVSVKYDMGGAILNARSRAGKDWIDSNAIPGARSMAFGLLVDSRSIGDVIRAMQGDGLEVHCGE
jgi:hypothetical protein